MTDPRSSTHEVFAGRWTLLFPITYLVHIAEEYGAGFVERAAEVTGLPVSEAAFLAANGLFWVMMVAGVVLALRQPRHSWLVVGVATIVVINTVAHLGGALLFGGYSPGLISALLLWLPLGVATLRRAMTLLPRSTVRAGVVFGAVAHLLVPVIGATFTLALARG